MKIYFKKIGERYAFDIIDEESRIIYASNLHYFLTPHVQSDYQYAWEACRDSYKLLFKRPYHLFAARDDMTNPVIVDVSAEQMLTNHYMGIFEGIREQVGGMGDDPKERDYLYKNIKIIEGELNKIIETLTDHKSKKSFRIILSRLHRILRKYFKKEEAKEENEMREVVSSTLNTLKIAKNEYILGPEIKKELIEDYAQKVCRTIQNKHPDAYYNFDLDHIEIMDKNDECILQIAVNKNINITSVIPCGALRKANPFYSNCFYQKYWKTIVEAIGYIVLGNPPVLITPEPTTFPDVPKENVKYLIKGWNTKDQQEQPIEISFHNNSWSITPCGSLKIKEASSKYMEQDYRDAIIKCIDMKLDSIYDRTGVVLQVIPHTDIIELDIDFGRGLGVIRLTEKQVEIISV